VVVVLLVQEARAVDRRDGAFFLVLTSTRSNGEPASIIALSSSAESCRTRGGSFGSLAGPVGVSMRSGDRSDLRRRDVGIVLPTGAAPSGRRSAPCPVVEEPAVGRFDSLRASRSCASNRAREGASRRAASAAPRQASTDRKSAPPPDKRRCGRFGKHADALVLARADVDIPSPSYCCMRKRHASARSSTCRNSRFACSCPEGDLPPPLDLRVVELANHRREDVRRLQIEVVVRPYRFVGIAEMKLHPYCRR